MPRGRRRKALPTAAIALSLIATSAFAAGTGAPKFTLHKAVPANADGIAPDTITAGPDGNVWFTESNNHVGRMNPRTGAVKSFRLPGGTSLFDVGGVTSGPGKYVWVAASNAIDRITPGSGAVKMFKLPSTSSSPHGITKGPDGNLWFGDGGTGSIGRLVPSTGVITDFPEQGGNPDGIVTGPDHNVWFTEGGSSLGKVNPATGAVTQITLPSSSCNSGGTGPSAWGITVGPDHNLWFTTYITDEIGRYNPRTGKLKMFCIHRPTSGNEFTIGIAAGHDGNIWFTTESTGDLVGRINPSTGKVKRFALPAGFDGGGPGITLGPDRHLWVTLPTVKKIARLH